MADNHNEDLPLCKPLISYHDGELITEIQSEFQNIQIIKHPLYGHQLVIDDDLQISESDDAYNQAMVAPLLSKEHIEEIAILGGGDGGVLKEALGSLRERPEFNKATQIEIDHQVIRLCRQYLAAFNQNAYEDPLAEVIIGDALGYIENTRRLDGVIYDLTMDPIREGYEHAEFIHFILKTIRKSLKPGGILSMQCCGQYSESESEEQNRLWLLEQIHKSANELYVGVIEQHVYVPSFHEMWTFLAAVKPE